VSSSNDALASLQRVRGGAFMSMYPFLLDAGDGDDFAESHVVTTSSWRKESIRTCRSIGHSAHERT
jgi:hypothetical protein